MIELRGLHLGNIARSRAESVRPDLWPDHAWVPALGCTGGVLYDLCRGMAGATDGPSWGPAKLSFDGINDHVLFPSSTQYDWQDFCITAGVKATSSSQTGTIACIPYSTFTNPYYSFTLRLNTNLTPFFVVVGSTYSERLELLGKAGDLELNTWASLHASYFNRSGGLYVNGKMVATGGSGPTISYHGVPLRVGINTIDRFYPFNGEMAYIYVHFSRLYPQQILDLTADPLLPFRRRQPVYYSVPSGGGTTRSLIAALTGESSTGTIAAIVARALSGDVTATSITGAITASMARELLASLPGQSTTGDVAATLQRLLLASLGGSSLTGDVTATMSGIVSLIAAINGQSATGTAAATQARALLADLQASSTTPDIAATLAALVALTANISGTTTTPAVAATMARALAANLAGQSATGAIAVEFAGMLLLVASIAGTSTTGALTATTGRELRAAIATASATRHVDGQMLRKIAATIAGTSLTGSIAAELVSLVSLAASVVGVSLAPAVVATLSRDLAADVAAGSTTGAASATVARTLAAAVEAGGLTPDNLVLILTGLGILHDTTIISRTPRRGISSRTVRRTLHSA